jgi:predicted  nucleic acid-binding Zn-ribbon protein
MEMLKSSKAIAAATTVLLVASLFWLMNTKSVNSSLEAGLQKEKLKSESLLSEKLLLERDLQKVRDQLLSLRGKNFELDNRVRNTSARLEALEPAYNRIMKENASLVQIKKQRQDLITLQSQLENELQSLKNSCAALEAKNSALNTTVASLEERNKMLTNDLNKALFVSVDHAQIQAVKEKTEKLTIRAKRTKKLIANFEIPANLKNLSFRILDTQGNALAHNDGTIASTLTPSDKSYTASLDPEVQGNKLQNVEMIYVPKGKLKTGVYTVEILNENLYVGSLKVKLK